MCRLAGGAEAGGDLALGVAEAAQSDDGGLGGGVQLAGEVEQLGQAFHVPPETPLTGTSRPYGPRVTSATLPPP